MLDVAEWASCSDIGRVRSANEDRSAGDPASGLYAVADGIGSTAGGDVAAETAIDVLMDEAGRTGSPALVLERAFQMANSRVVEVGGESRLRGLGSTLSALTIRDELATVAHVGDSRVYRLRGSDLQLLTTDHSHAMHIGSRGPTQVLTQYLGQPDRSLDVEIRATTLADGDVFLLCTDGVHRAMSESEIGSLIRETSPTDACRVLIDRADEAGGYDNATAMIVTISLCAVAT